MPCINFFIKGFNTKNINPTAPGITAKIKKKKDMEYCSTMASIELPIKPAIKLPRKFTKYQTPNIIPIFLGGTNLET